MNFLLLVLKAVLVYFTTTTLKKVNYLSTLSYHKLCGRLLFVLTSRKGVAPVFKKFEIIKVLVETSLCNFAYHRSFENSTIKGRTASLNEQLSLVSALFSPFSLFFSLLSRFFLAVYIFGISHSGSFR